MDWPGFPSIDRETRRPGCPHYRCEVWRERTGSAQNSDSSPVRAAQNTFM